jgi:thiol-disulfide isomerase/thioredoxin
MEQAVAWDTLSAEDQERRLKQVGQLLHEHGLSKIKPKTLDQVVIQIKQNKVVR